jgi:hypothetical protein
MNNMLAIPSMSILLIYSLSFSLYICFVKKKASKYRPYYAEDNDIDNLICCP